MELQELQTNAKTNERFKSGDNLEILNLQDENYQYLYSDGNAVHLLQPESFETIEMSADACEGGDRALSFLEDGMPIAVSFLTTPEHGRKPYTFKLPPNHTFTVASVTERGGQAAKGTVFKNATLENGANVQVPEFVNAGDKIILDLETMKYMKRDLAK
ncbi:uncharacterized protein BYT42DRAFT_596119 [Radiomyces spectabilis]|uniref:uncharacterized protein n=1 Tax=Radiomyces spectabilis TaxID=64574 RepID=UPI00221FDAB1|nr:uncharacterized protein BYT42DRAFT_596119 [Radiomyces spectabilis]KAI8365403.1 hypothetical protein BYT42DRAFT_596119 [Radiomyces spectabilis]